MGERGHQARNDKANKALIGNANKWRLKRIAEADFTSTVYRGEGWNRLSCTIAGAGIIGLALCCIGATYVTFFQR